MSSETQQSQSQSLLRRSSVREAVFAFGTFMSVLTFCLGLVSTILAMSLGLDFQPNYPIPVPAGPEAVSLPVLVGLLAGYLAVVLAGVGIRRARDRFEDEAQRRMVFAAGTLVLGFGIYLLLLFFSTSQTGSSPHFTTELDQMLLLATGLVLMYGGYHGVHLAARWVGWS